MDPLNRNPHISRRFTAELDEVCNRVLIMGGIVEQQIRDALTALCELDPEAGERVLRNDFKVNAMEVAIDEECTRILARRQPTATDLRMVVAVLKTITDLERMGDEAERIGRVAINLSEHHDMLRYTSGIHHLGDLVQRMVRDALNAFARLDTRSALAAARLEEESDREYQSLKRQLMSFMMAEPRAITPLLEVIWSARALERIGDHARNVGEYVIYLVYGKDVRHISIAEMESALSKWAAVSDGVQR